MSATYHIRIKQEYANAIIEELRKKDALEVIPEDQAFEVPLWQQEEVRRRIELYKNTPEAYIDEDTFFEMLNKD